jgi:hypothetical protein
MSKNSTAEDIAQVKALKAAWDTAEDRLCRAGDELFDARRADLVATRSGRASTPGTVEAAQVAWDAAAVVFDAADSALTSAATRISREEAAELGILPDEEAEQAHSDWVDRERERYAAGELSAEQVADLECLPGWCWRPSPEWEERMEAARWVDEQRRAYADGSLEDWKIAKLEALKGWTWDIDSAA